ncbi:hypothetical protein Zmor_012268 [Zophobas morio]|jgi:nitroreductase|uniref:Nitroreductase domain-containing protein n=1 Tax=Zophobas morio TaxID=2755281 RepID=A0AA38HGT6_9CUCU|nr:hypothetical protein Zmor_012268 [Zophobas morio]
MKNLTDLMNERFAAKAFLNEGPINDDDLKLILEASNLAPTAFGIDQCRVLVYRTKKGKDQFNPYLKMGNEERVSSSSAFIIYIGQTKEALFANDEEVLKRNTPYFDFTNEKLKILHDALVASYEHPEGRAEFYDIIAVSNKSSYMTLKAKELGYDSVIMTGLDQVGMTEYLKSKNLLIEGERVILGCALGHADMENYKNVRQSSTKNRVPYDVFATIVD